MSSMSMGNTGRRQQHVLSEQKPVGSGQVCWFLAHMTHWTNHSTLLPNTDVMEGMGRSGLGYCTERVKLHSSK